MNWKLTYNQAKHMLWDFSVICVRVYVLVYYKQLFKRVLMFLRILTLSLLNAQIHIISSYYLRWTFHMFHCIYSLNPEELGVLIWHFFHHCLFSNKIKMFRPRHGMAKVLYEKILTDQKLQSMDKAQVDLKLIILISYFTWYC